MKQLTCLFFVSLLFTAIAAQQNFDITSMATPGGTISLSGIVTVQQGASQQFIFTPMPGYKIDHLEVDGQTAYYKILYNNQGAFGSYTFMNVQARHTIQAFFVKANSFIIHTYSDGQGTITPSGNTITMAGANSPVFSITADDGWTIYQVLVDNVLAGPLQPSDHFTYQFSKVMANHELAVHFISKQDANFIISALRQPGGSINPVYRKAKAGDSLTFTITPDRNFVIAALKDNSTEYGQLSAYPVFNYTIHNVFENHVLQPLFDSATHAIYTFAEPGGSVSPAMQRVPYGLSSQPFQIKADPGNIIGSILVDGVPLTVGATGVTSYTFSYVYAPHQLTAQFIPAGTQYTISTSAGDGGTISPNGLQAAAGSSASFQIQAQPGFTIGTVWTDSTIVNQYSDPKTSTFAYTFPNIHASHLLRATFVPLNSHYTITVQSAAHGTISPSQTTSVNYGDSAHFDVIADPGYRIQDVLADNRSVLTATTPVVQDHHTFFAVRSDHSIAATYSPLAVPYFHISTSYTPEISNVFGPPLVDSGGSQTYQITGRHDFQVALSRLLIDGYPVSPDTSYTFRNVTSDHSLEADFTGMPACNFLSIYDLPASIPIPSLDRTFNHIYVYAGAGATDLGRGYIHWDAASRKMIYFLIFPLNKNGMNDLTGATQTFGLIHPSITLAGTNVGQTGIINQNNLDNVYDANVTGGSDLVLVPLSGLYMIQFTDNAPLSDPCQPPMQQQQMAFSRVPVAETYLNGSINLAPNPFYDQLIIHYDIAKPAAVSWFISDITGRVVLKGAENQWQQTGAHVTEIHCNGWSSGMYFCTITIGSERKTIRIIHLR